MAMALEKLTGVEAAIADVVAELYEVFSSDGALQDAAARSAMLEKYMQNVGRIGMLARRAGLDGVHESCFYFYQVLQALNKDDRVLSAGQLAQLEQWPFVISACLHQPFSIEMVESLLDYFRSDLWPIGLPAPVVNDIYDAFRRQDAPATADLADPGDAAVADLAEVSSAQTAAAVLQYFSPELVAALEQEMVAATNALFDDLAAAAESGDDGSIGAAFEMFADRLDLMLMSVEDAGIDGLVEVCKLFQANLRALGERGTVLSLDEGQTLSAWPALVNHYLACPLDTAAIEALVDYLSVLPEAAPVAAEQRVHLQQALLSDSAGAAVTAEDGPEPGVTDAESLTQPPVEETPASDELEAAPEDAVGDALAVAGDTLSELVQLVRMELVFVADEFSAAMQTFAADGDSAARARALDSHAEMVDRLRQATESMGLLGLARVLAHIYDNVDRMSAPGAPVEDGQLALLQRWPDMVLAYIDGLSEGLGCQPLVDYLQAQHWPVAIDQHSVDGILAQLRSPELSIEDELSEPRQTQANADDVSLAVPDDINPQLVDSLLQELPGHTAEFNNAINRLLDGKGTLQDVDSAQRVAHTLKGSANTVGIRGIANLTHHIEDILAAFARQGSLPGRTLAGTLLEAADVLEMMSEALLGQGPAPQQAQAALQAVLDWANRIDREGVAHLEENGGVTAGAAPETGTPADSAVQKSAGDSVAMVRVPADMVDDLLRLVGESIILTGQLQNRLNQAESQTESVRSQHALFQQLTAELEHLVETQGLTAAHARSSLQAEFDTLELERYNELHTVTHRLVEAATDAAELTAGIEDHQAVLDDLLVDQHKLLKDEQQLVMRTRMVPVQNVVPRLQRAVRQAGRQTGKQVHLVVEGAETLIDSQVLNDLVDPLTHLLRNAVDHGIEAVDTRLDADKPEAGRIEVRFARQGDHIRVTCSDDGAGLDLAAIKAKARACDLLPPDHEPGDEELTRLILLPGFSTRSETTQVSGRGIGMDAVHSRVNELKGTLQIESTAGAGCKIELQLPLSMISVHALLVPAGAQSIAVSSRGVDQILYPGAGTLIRDGDRLTFTSEDRVYDAWHLETLLQMPVPADAEQLGERPVLLVRDENASVCAVCVANVQATRDMVVKQLGPYVARRPGIEGTTILGDGSVAPLVDLPMLLGIATRDNVTGLYDRPVRFERGDTRPCALVVDDSLSARRSLAEFMQDLGYEVLSARDGLEAIEVMAERNPQVALLDLEMPRMNGLELAAHIRAQPRTRDLPIIMITSRSTAKHRDKAEAAGVNAYLTKPFSEDTLNDQIQAVTAIPEPITA